MDLFQVFLVFCLCLIFGVLCDSTATNYADRVVLKVNEQYFNEVKEGLKQDNYTFLYEIVPGVYVFQMNKTDRHRVLGEAGTKYIQEKFHGKVEAVEQVRQLRMSPVSVEPRHSNHEHNSLYEYGMGIPDAWKKGFTGKGVTVAVLDVGVNISHPDLINNVNKTLDKNFISQTSDVLPEQFPSYKAESLHLTDHGNRVSGIIASTNSNGRCSTGVAYNSTLSVLKVAEINEGNWDTPNIASDNYARALAYRSQDIHIYCNALGYVSPFSALDLASKYAIETGIVQGRQKKGSIFVYPAGKVGNGFANSPYTFAVSAIGQNGTVPDYTQSSAAVLTSAFGDGNNLKTASMMTTSSNWPSECTTDFAGLSAATAFVTATATFALEANPDLTWRDLMHVIVQASESDDLHESHNFRENAAGIPYHNVLGFGILNAAKVSDLSSTWKSVSEMVMVAHAGKTKQEKKCELVTKPDGSTVHVCTYNNTLDIACEIDGACVESVEQILTVVQITTPSLNDTSLYITSPSGTKSLLLAAGEITNTEAALDEDMQFRSVQLWGEKSSGIWSVVLETKHEDEATLKVKSFTVYGTGRNHVVPPVTPAANTDERSKPVSIGAVFALLYPIVIFGLAGLFLGCANKYGY